MLYQRKEKPQPPHITIQENENLFVEGYRTPAGPLKWLSEEDKNRIHLQIEFKMDQIEQTGLSRDEILLDKPGGLPLSQDPVFQFLRHNRAAREMLVKPGEEFTADKVLDYALRQDIGVDRSKILPEGKNKFDHELPADYDRRLMVSKRLPTKIKPEDYF